MFRIAVIGGDERARRLAALCAKENLDVTTLGLLERDEMSAAIEEADILLFPYPFSVKGVAVPNLMNLYIDPAEVLARAKDGALVLAGKGLDPYVTAVHALGKSLSYKQYQDDPAFLRDNTEISAEGALSYAMQQLDVTIADALAVVVGYGLFGQALARKLHSLGASVVVTARSEAARALAQSNGLHAVDLTELTNVSKNARLLMNTVPSPVIGSDVLAALPSDVLLLELASAPYGFDMEEAQQKGLASAALPSIPARYAPESAAHALYQSMNRLINSERVE